MPDEETLVSEVIASTVPGDERSCLAALRVSWRGHHRRHLPGGSRPHHAGDAADTLADVVRSKPDLVVVDVSQVAFFDCGAIGEFVRARPSL